MTTIVQTKHLERTGCPQSCLNISWHRTNVGLSAETEVDGPVSRKMNQVHIALKFLGWTFLIIWYIHYMIYPAFSLHDVGLWRKIYWNYPVPLRKLWRENFLQCCMNLCQQWIQSLTQVKLQSLQWARGTGFSSKLSIPPRIHLLHQSTPSNAPCLGFIAPWLRGLQSKLLLWACLFNLRRQPSSVYCHADWHSPNFNLPINSPDIVQMYLLTQEIWGSAFLMSPLVRPKLLICAPYLQFAWT